MAENIVHLTQTNFDEYIEKSSMLIIDFWNERCVPCRVFSDVLNEIAPDYPDIVFGKIDTDTESELANEFGVRSVPHILILRDKVMLYSDSGTLSVNVLRKMLDDAKLLNIEKIKKKPMQTTR